MSQCWKPLSRATVLKGNEYICLIEYKGERESVLYTGEQIEAIRGFLESGVPKGKIFKSLKIAALITPIHEIGGYYEALRD